MAAPPAKRRRSNFSNEELIVTIREATERKTLISGRLDSTSVMKEGKKNAWVAVPEAVSAFTLTTRTEDEVREKFYDF